MNLWIIFLTGLTTGGISCMAVQGGLLASVIANQKKEESKKGFDALDWMPVGVFLIAKLFIHTIFGFLLGAIGAVISLSLGIRLAFQIFTALFMISTAMNLLNVHPIFRYLAIQPPRFIQRLIHSKSKSRALFAPAMLGLLTIFIPCGVTQAMEVLAINSANAINGGLTMFAFVLGTAPLFAALGIATSQFSEKWKLQFSKAAAFVLIVLALYNLNGVMVALDSPFSLARLNSYLKAEDVGVVKSEEAVSENQSLQKVTLNIVNNGYQPNYFQVKADRPVELQLVSNNVYSCALSFVFRQFDIFTQLKPTDSQTFTFTPKEKGKFRFSCSMGMFSGAMEVI